MVSLAEVGIWLTAGQSESVDNLVHLQWWPCPGAIQTGQTLWHSNWWGNIAQRLCMQISVGNHNAI